MRGVDDPVSRGRHDARLAVDHPQQVRFRLFDVQKQSQLASFSYVVAPAQLRATAHRIADFIYEKLTAGEFLRFHAGLYGMDDGDIEARIKEMLDIFELGRWQNELVESFSHGMKQRLVMAAAFMHKPGAVLATNTSYLDVDEIAGRVITELADREVSTFRVSARRADKRFPLSSPQIEREIVIDAPIERVWELVTDIGLPSRFSSEFRGATWVDGGPVTVTLPVSKATVASRLSLTPEYFSRVLHDFEAKGLVQIDRREIRIPDPQRLADYRMEARPPGLVAMGPAQAVALVAAGRKASEKQAPGSSPCAPNAGTAVSTICSEPQL